MSENEAQQERNKMDAILRKTGHNEELSMKIVIDLNNERERYLSVLIDLIPDGVLTDEVWNDFFKVIQGSSCPDALVSNMKDLSEIFKNYPGIPNNIVWAYIALILPFDGITKIIRDLFPLIPLKTLQNESNMDAILQDISFNIFNLEKDPREITVEKRVALMVDLLKLYNGREPERLYFWKSISIISLCDQGKEEVKVVYDIIELLKEKVFVLSANYLDLFIRRLSRGEQPGPARLFTELKGKVNPIEKLEKTEEARGASENNMNHSKPIINNHSFFRRVKNTAQKIKNFLNGHHGTSEEYKPLVQRK